MKVFLGGMLGIALVFGLAMPLPAEENDFIGMQSSLFFNTNAYMNIGYDILAAETETGNQGFSTGQRVGAGFMNIFFGLGSYTMGDWRGGLWLTLFDVLTIPVFALSINFWMQEFEPWALPKYFTTGNFYMDMILLVPVAYGVLVIGWVAYHVWPYLGVASYAANLVYKFIRPFQYKGPSAKTARLDDFRNWYVGLMPNENGKASGQIAFTAHF